MDISIELLTDVAINALGYLAAGAFSVVVYRLFQGGSRAAVQPPVVAVAAAPADNGTSDSGRDRPGAQFVRLGNEGRQKDAVSTAGECGTGGARRDRSEVIRLAREMVRAGTPNQQIKDLLPVTEAELALLSHDQ
ncbi:MAG: hypothetical protein OEW00_01175 [candidate division Zixibacteria bacterium]|nr:hypothetical protein [candidate division Zixibacteria bacterium]